MLSKSLKFGKLAAQMAARNPNPMVMRHLTAAMPVLKPTPFV